MSRKANHIEDVAPEKVLITFDRPKSAMSEAYRLLSADLGFAGMERPFRSVLVTSPQPEDGKSSVVSNLAVVTAQAGYKVMLVDCDLRKPKQHRIFQVPNSVGFTNCIINNMDPEKAAFDLNISNLKLLTSGPIHPNPAEILNSGRTRQLWRTLAGKYDYVFIDSPPILPIADASILSSQVDGVLLVVRPGFTRADATKKIKEQMTMANARLIGIVLNQVKMNFHEYYQYEPSDK